MSISNLSTSTIDLAVREAYERDGYIKSDGFKDIQKVCSNIFEIISENKVLNKKERTTKAVKKGDLAVKVFPSLIWDFDSVDEADRPLVEAVYKRIVVEVWELTNTAADKRLQRMVGMNMGNGYVLCRTKVGTNRTDAVYITDVKECIHADYIQPDNAALKKRIQTSTRNREMLILRQPHNATSYSMEYEKMLKAALTEAHNQLELSREATTKDQDSEDEEDSE